MLALLTALIVTLALRAAVAWHGAPIAGVLVDPELMVSSFGLPDWSGPRQGLAYPDRVVRVDGIDLLEMPPLRRASAWNGAIENAYDDGRRSITVEVASRHGNTRVVDLAITPMESTAWWLYGGGLILIGALYVATGVIAFSVRPEGRLARSTAKMTILLGLLFITVFDYHTSRTLVPFFYVAFACVPSALVTLAMRLPDEPPWLASRPWIPLLLDLPGFALAIALNVTHFSGSESHALTMVTSWLLGPGLLAFIAILVARYVMSQGERRDTLRRLFFAMLPAYAIGGIGGLLIALRVGTGAIAFFIVPAFALTPPSVLAAFIRRDLFGSGALLSRVLTRVIIVAVVGVVAVAIGAGIATLAGVSLVASLTAAAPAGFIAAGLCHLALGAGDRTIFPSRAAYKPTVAELSEELTLLTSPAEVADATLRTVKRWLPCDAVELRLISKAEPEDPSESGDRKIGFATQPGLTEHIVSSTFRGAKLAEILVGKKRGGALYTSDDLDLLKTIANQAGLALAHAYTYEELERRRREEAAAWKGERSALIETVAAEIAHEVRYPINFFRSVFRSDADGGLDAEEREIGREEVERLERLVAGLRRVATRQALVRTGTRIKELVTKVEILLRDKLAGRRLVLDGDAELAVLCDPDQAVQLLVNLVSNALDAAGDVSSIGVTWSRTREGATVIVWDQGPGFGADASRIFAPWFTTKPRGTGLGLSIAHRIVRAHGWNITAQRADATTKFVIQVPARSLATPGSSEEDVQAPHADEEEVA